MRALQFWKHFDPVFCRWVFGRRLPPEVLTGKRQVHPWSAARGGGFIPAHATISGKATDFPFRRRLDTRTHSSPDLVVAIDHTAMAACRTRRARIVYSGRSSSRRGTTPFPNHCRAARLPAPLRRFGCLRHPPRQSLHFGGSPFDRRRNCPRSGVRASSNRKRGLGGSAAAGWSWECGRTEDRASSERFGPRPVGGRGGSTPRSLGRDCR
jgi:hypothetical protein